MAETDETKWKKGVLEDDSNVMSAPARPVEPPPGDPDDPGPGCGVCLVISVVAFVLLALFFAAGIIWKFGHWAFG